MMAEKIDEKELVSFRDLLISEFIQSEALIFTLVKKEHHPVIE